MTNPVSFPSSTPNYSLPLLFAGQAQKEFFVNQSMSVIDALLQNSVVQSRGTPAATPSDGECYRVLSNATGEWAGHDDELALWIGSSWVFVTPSIGMSIFDKEAESLIRYENGWVTAVTPSLPNGGTTIDTEARDTIAQLIDVLRTSGILPPST